MPSPHPSTDKPGDSSKQNQTGLIVFSPRVTRVCLDISAGFSVLVRGAESAQQLWNQTRDYQEQHFRQTGHYLHLFELQKLLRRKQNSLSLSDRCFSFVLRRYQGNLTSWLKNRPSYPKANPPGIATKPQPLLFEVGRNAIPIGPWTYRLAVLNKRADERYAVVKIRTRPGIKMNQVKLIQVQPDLTGRITYYLKLQVEPPGEQIAGIDLGIYNLVTIAFQSGESIQYSGQAILELDQSIPPLIKRGKSAGNGTPLADKPLSKKRQKRLRKIKNTRWLAIHNLTHSVVQECLKRQVGVIVIGDLTHIRRGKSYRKLRTWSFYQITEQLTYKAAEVGIRVISIKEWYTSQLCHRCGERGKRTQKGRLFCCQQCNDLLMDADVNAAFNILNHYVSVPTLAHLGLINNGTESTNTTSKKATSKKRPYFGPTYFATFTTNYTIVLRRNDGS